LLVANLKAASPPPGGVTTKLRLLNIEGAQVGDAPTLFESLPLAARPRRR
jgi:methylated-DNA-[protein]-cysteine S-methyltransferase